MLVRHGSGFNGSGFRWLVWRDGIDGIKPQGT